MRLLKSFIKGVTAIYDLFVKAMVVVACLLIVFMMVSIGASVIFRNSIVDFGWALEFSEISLIVITLFGSGWLIKTGGHVRVDIVTTLIHGRKNALYNGCIFSIVTLICLIFTVIGFDAAYDVYTSGVQEIKVYLTFQKWILLSLFPFAGFFMVVESGKVTVRYFRKYFAEVLTH